jgi:hypothetical protein
MTTNLGFDIELPLAFSDAVARVKDALKQEGFGILTEIGCRRPSARSWVASSDPIRIAPREPPAIPRAVDVVDLAADRDNFRTPTTSSEAP